MSGLARAFSAVVVLATAVATTAMAQERFSIFVGSDPTNVERMLKLAKLKDDDHVIDLGSGDGRIVIGAAKLNPKLAGTGVDIDAKLVAQAGASAQEQGVGDRVRFLHQNAFDADLSNVSVIFMWLWPEIQTMLRPKILAQARPGTRVVTNVWDLGSWQPDEIDSDGPAVSLWYVPARVAGSWAWELRIHGAIYRYTTLLEQRFQRAEGFTRVGNRRGIFSEVVLRGEDLKIKLELTLGELGYVRHEFSGKARGDAIEGTVRLTIPANPKRGPEETIDIPWRATRTQTTGYLAPTGLDAP